MNNTNKAEDHRLINALPNMERMLEFVVKNQIIGYNESKSMLTRERLGFRSKHLRETVLIGLYVNGRNGLKIISRRFL